MSESSIQIVVGIDFEQGSAWAVHAAARLAIAHGDEAQVHAVHAIEPESDLAREDAELEHVPFELRRFLREQGSPVSMEVTRLFGVHARLGEPASVLLQLAVDVDADFIVVGPHAKSGLDRRTVGSVTTALLRDAGCPVLIARPKDYGNLAKTDVVESACDDCVATRRATGGRTWWCSAHEATAQRRHVMTWTGETTWSAIHGGTRSTSRLF